MKLATLPRIVRRAGLGLALLLCAASASAQMYKWVDASGKTHFTTTPPPPTAKTVNVRKASEDAPAVPLPYALSQAVRNAPVVLFTAESCSGCDMGRDYLKRRGIPFTEKTVRTGNDEAKLKEAGSNGQLPLLVVGKNKSIGFESGQWEGTLNQAGYPPRSMLPNNYVFPTPAPASPPVQVAAAAPRPAPVEPPRRKKTQDEEPTAPPGFQF